MLKIVLKTLKTTFCFYNILLIFLHLNQAFAQKCQNGRLDGEGLFKIYAMLSIEACNPNGARARGVAQAEALKYVINEANRQFNKSLIGYTIYDIDDYSKLDYTVNATLDIILSPTKRFLSPNIAYNNIFFKSNKFEPTALGLLGLVSSENAIYAHQAFSFTDIPIISYSATSDDLSDKKMFPNFYRTVPPDSFQALLFSDLLLHFNWTYVSVVASDDSYGRSGTFQLVQKLSKVKICVKSQDVIINESKQDSLILSNIESDPRVRVIIYWGDLKSLKYLLTESKKRKIFGKVWILSEGVGLDNWIIEFMKTFEGSIMILNPYTYTEQNFKQKFLSITYNDATPWLKMLFQQNGINELKSKFTVSNIQNLFDYRRVGYLQTSANVLINAFVNYTKTQCNIVSNNILSCNDLIYNRNDFNNIVKSISFSYKNNDIFQFDENQNPVTASYDLFVVTNSKFELTASWTSNKGFKIINSSVFDSFQVTSACSQACPPGHQGVFHKEIMCCWACGFCPKNQVKSTYGQSSCVKCMEEKLYISNPNRTKCVKLNQIYWSFYSNNNYLFVTFSFFISGATITFVFMLTFILKRNTPIVKASNYWLSITQMTLHFLLFNITFLAIGKGSNIKCFFTMHVSGLLYFLIINVTWLKVKRLVAVFGTLHKLRKKDMQRIRFKEFITFLVANLLYVSVMLTIEAIKPINISLITDENALTINEFCKSETNMLVHVCCILTLMVFCAIELFKGRNLPLKYDDTRFIAVGTFSSVLIKILAVPLGYSLNDANNYKTMLYTVINISNFLLLITSYMFKIKIILFEPNSNVRTGFNRNRNKIHPERSVKLR
ncbi:extracellular calcium-sensing receptor [Hydra vulgaris]|uniref:extracellular calcium-sensing receptor n=1 Tax=Hydra vulgaris TaxID=6087 RepID=UPI001F5E6B34|nr:extracellular calcium-sensing receptor [Hydra vulgaris]